MERFKGLIGGVPPLRLFVMAGVGTVLLALLAWVAVSGGSSDKTYLFTDLDPAAAADITQKLTAAGVDYSLSADGTAILAPRDRIAELRMSMAGEQLGGKIGYEILDAEQPFGLSSAREKLNATRALEGELARSIATLQPVRDARVHIVMPERALFAAEGRKATAAVTVKTRARLSTENVAAIRSLVSAAVPELSPDAVSVVDQSGRLLARAGDGGGAGSSDIDERQSEVENRLRSQIEELIEPIVGAGKVRAEVSADIVREQVRTEARTFDPDKQVIAHQISVESGDRSQATDGGAGAVSVSTQLPDAAAASKAGGGAGNTSASNETSEDTSYDNSRTDTVTMAPAGAIRKLSVAVMVDGGKKGIPPATIQRIQRLVEGAVGFDAQRGDVVAVETIPFVAPPDEAASVASLLESLPTSAIFDMLKLAVIAAVGLFVLRLVRAKGAEADAAPGQQPQLAGRDAPAGALPSPDAATSLAELDQQIALAQVEGGIKASSLKRLGDTIQANPAESASVIRNWMNT